MTFVIFHGAFGNPEGNWFPELGERLKSLGQKVILPGFPVDDWDQITQKGPSVKATMQNLDSWLATFETVLPEIEAEKNLPVFVGHSLGPLFILHVVTRFNIRLNSAIFVSPFMNSLDSAWQLNAVNSTFYKNDFDFIKLKKLIPFSYVLYSDNDPYVPKKESLYFAGKLNSSVIEVAGASHMNYEVNLNEFPLVLELCKSRLDLSLYQRYLDHRQKLYALDYVKDKNEEIIYIDPKEVFDEGVFHFRNLQSGGFCTFYTALKFWDTQSKYYEEARKAARRVKNLTRVFIIDKLDDLKSTKLLNQIKLDIEAGIKVYLCRYRDIENEITEPDFGIWDDEYLCIVPISGGRINKVKLSSRIEDIKEAKKWQKLILDKAKKINNTDTDIRRFIKKYK